MHTDTIFFEVDRAFPLKGFIDEHCEIRPCGVWFDCQDGEEIFHLATVVETRF